jgi:hypothetical protein
MAGDDRKGAQGTGGEVVAFRGAALESDPTEVAVVSSSRSEAAP